MSLNLEGLIQVLSSIVPTNLNPRQWVVRAYDVLGADQSFDTVAELVSFHPYKMKRGMKARVSSYPAPGVTTEFVLNQDPALLVNANKDSIITQENFLSFWDTTLQVNTNRGRIWNYSPDGPGGGPPLFPYVDYPTDEANWVPIYDKTKGHRWLRFRDDDAFVTVSGTQIFTGWTAPIPVNQTFENGDYMENKFMRYAVSATTHSGVGTLTANKWYVVTSGKINVTVVNPSSRLYVEYLRLFGPSGTDPLVLTSGRVFQYEAINTYVFVSSTVVETVPAPPRIIGGLPNNDALYPVDFSIIGTWTDAVPGGANQLWKVFGPKSLRQQLKGEWLIEKIIENPSYVRYSNIASPHPDTLTGDPHNTPATTGSGYDTALVAAGWVSVYDNHDFMATRQDDPGAPLFTSWLVEKIREESGEFEDFYFKLGPIRADIGDPTLPTAPTVRDATTQGWSDVPQQETDTDINYITTVRKFFDGSLKTPYSDPVPYTGQSTFKDDIISDKGDNFKYSIVSGAQVIVPDYILLTSRVFKGLSKLWENSDVTIEYTWWKVYDNGAALGPIQEAVTDATPISTIGVLFGYMPASGVLGTPGYINNRQQVVIKPGAVTGKAVFRVRQRVYFSPTSYQDFIQEFSVIDISDGIDAKSVVLTTDTFISLWDSVGAAMTPAAIQMRYYQSNLNPLAFVFKYQKKWATNVWVDALGQGGLSIVGNVISIDTSNVNIFTQDASRQEIRIAIMNWNGDPEVPDPDTDKYSDIVTIVKISSTAVGTPGTDSVALILSNESHILTLDSFGTPLAGEIGSGGAASTILQLWDGVTKKLYTTDWTIASIVSDDAGVTFAHVASGTDRKVYINTWGAGERRAKATVTITYGARTFVREFSVASSLDAPGAITIDIDSDKGFSFDGFNRTSKTLTAHAYNDQVVGGEDNPNQWYFKWFIAGIAVQGPTLGGSPGFGEKLVVDHTDVRFSAQVTVMIAKTALELTGTEDPFRTRTIEISDITDTQKLIMWTDFATFPGSPPTSYKGATSTSVVGSATWRKSTDVYWNTHDPIYASEGAENPAGVIDVGDGKPYWVWTKAYRIAGEKGDQGGQGNFFFSMYIASSSTPAFGIGGTNSSLAQMITAGWTSHIPSSGIIWEARRLWEGEGVVFDLSGNPSTGPVLGGLWLGPLQLSQKDITGIVNVPGAAYTLLAGDIGKIHQMNNTGVRTVTLPLIATCKVGVPFWIKDSARTGNINGITVQRTAPNVMEDGSNSFVLRGKGSIIGVYTDGVKWFLM